MAAPWRQRVPLRKESCSCSKGVRTMTGSNVDMATNPEVVLVVSESGS